mmetsp:Transcript_11248/g.18849  ORF Transcript_11248/g.18849 Transcript_11248/m.18849 type:complete len:387 (-) Transcript_11248:325-1485(-)|eukprot:CAMPEP_0119311048 /NCGR_PEP_ID=MMETSP1333-20130426/21404_1 /TAXON_ID=418940 /ORGANISM="Scyphosphaera apsteinii, Strain RCC1455" /LENGTH=386 /DNA_ID=CAMNT_0007315341 /DNA_START=23 /DNA_END=1183 /DNA_ORIENTATION=+
MPSKMQNALLLALPVTLTFAELQIQQYAGPTDCEDAERVKVERYLALHYTGYIDISSTAGTPGAKFFSSHDGRGVVYREQIGAGKFMQGWEQGLLGICKGAKVNLVIPPEMAYGETGFMDLVPANATLYFSIEVVDVSETKLETDQFVELDVDKDGRLTMDEVLAYFKEQGQDELPHGMMWWNVQDKDRDLYLSWEEFGGDKGPEKPEYARVADEKREAEAVPETAEEKKERKQAQHLAFLRKAQAMADKIIERGREYQLQQEQKKAHAKVAAAAQKAMAAPPPSSLPSTETKPHEAPNVNDMAEAMRQEAKAKVAKAKARAEAAAPKKKTPEELAAARVQAKEAEAMRQEAKAKVAAAKAAAEATSKVTLRRKISSAPSSEKDEM